MKHADVMNQIKQVALLLPETNYTTTEQVAITGEELLLTGVIEHEGKPILKDGMYSMENKVYHPFNHARRMKRIYNSNLKRGHQHAYKLLKDYITAVTEAAKNQNV